MAGLDIIHTGETLAFALMSIAFYVMARKLPALVAELRSMHNSHPTGCGRNCPAVRFALYKISEEAIRKDEERILKALTFYRNIEAATSEEERWKLKRQIGSEFGLVPPDYLLPSAILQQEIALLGALRQRYHGTSSLMG